MKPNKTISLLYKTTPNIHYPHSKHYIKKIKIQNSSPLIITTENTNYPIKNNLYTNNTSMINFPIKKKNFNKSKFDTPI